MLANKYERFSKAQEAKQKLKFSSVDQRDHTHAQPTQPRNDTYKSTNRERGLWDYPDAAQIDQRDPTTFGFSEIGYIAGAHGVKGEVKVKTDSDFATERLCQTGIRWIRRWNRRAPREIELLAGRPGPGQGNYLVRLGGIESREHAERLRGAVLYIRRELTPSLEEDEILLWQLDGLRVSLIDSVSTRTRSHDARPLPDDGTLAEGETVGRVIGVIPREELTGDAKLGNDLIEVELVEDEDDDNTKGSSQKTAPRVVLIPWVEAIVRQVCIEGGFLLIDPPSGLLELVQPVFERTVRIRGLLPPSPKEE